jgi:purine-nucleoside phosphorylase
VHGVGPGRHRDRTTAQERAETFADVVETTLESMLAVA